MPVKNAAIYLKQCLDSIMAQDFLDWELIAVNDHSDDHTWQILTNYADNCSKIIIYENIGSGIIPALQKAYAHASGAYITRMDADDIMSPNKLSALYNIIKHSKSGTVVTGKVKYFSEYPLGDGYKKYESWLNGLCENNSHFDEIYKECVIPSPCWMILRSDFDKCGAFNPNRYPEDYDLAFRFYKHKFQVRSSMEILHFWRDYAIRSSRTDSNYKDNRFLELKTEYFLTLDYKAQKKLYLWGAGKKAKQIAKILIANHIEFLWICNNHKKIGKNIYGVILEHQSTIKNNTQVIIAVANPLEQLAIKELLYEREFIDTYFFS